MAVRHRIAKSADFIYQEIKDICIRRNELLSDTRLTCNFNLKNITHKDISQTIMVDVEIKVFNFSGNLVDAYTETVEVDNYTHIYIPSWL